MRGAHSINAQINMNLSSSKISYVAGLLEGEGSFSCIDTPLISLNMTDKDVVVKFRNLVDPNRMITINTDSRPNRKTLYKFRTTGTRAISWMMTIYSLMGS
jgi:hypothetical protein